MNDPIDSIIFDFVYQKATSYWKRRVSQVIGRSVTLRNLDSVEINYGKKSFVLEKGDSIYYDSIVRHHVHGYNGQKARILAVVYTPI